MQQEVRQTEVPLIAGECGGFVCRVRGINFARAALESLVFKCQSRTAAATDLFLMLFSHRFLFCFCFGSRQNTCSLVMWGLMFSDGGLTYFFFAKLL